MRKIALVFTVSERALNLLTLILSYLSCCRSYIVQWLKPDGAVRGSGFLVGVSLGKTLQSPSPVLVKPRTDMNNISCNHEMTKLEGHVSLHMPDFSVTVKRS